MSIVIFIVSLAVLILVHEFGHFVTAKKAGIRVDEFGIGFPPKLFGKKYGETEYSFNLIPFGGFVRIFGENPDEEAAAGPDKARSFAHAPKMTQAAVIGAGVFFNFLLAWLLISAGFISGMPVSVASAPANAPVRDARVVVTSVEEGSPAEEAGLAVGDALRRLETAGERYENPSVAGIQDFVARHGGEEIAVAYTRGKEEGEARAVPEVGVFGDTPAIGIAMDEIGIVELLPHRALYEGLKMSLGLTVAIAVAFGGLIADAFTGNLAFETLTGPVGIVGLIGDAAGLGVAYLLSFVAFISLNLAVLNLLPIPALDGGRLFFLLIETVKGSRLSPKFVNTAHTAGFIALILLMLAITWNDVARIVAN